MLSAPGGHHRSKNIIVKPPGVHESIVRFWLVDGSQSIFAMRLIALLRPEATQIIPPGWTSSLMVTRILVNLNDMYVVLSAAMSQRSHYELRFRTCSQPLHLTSWNTESGIHACRRQSGNDHVSTARVDHGKPSTGNREEPRRPACGAYKYQAPWLVGAPSWGHRNAEGDSRHAQTGRWQFRDEGGKYLGMSSTPEFSGSSNLNAASNDGHGLQVWAPWLRPARKSGAGDVMLQTMSAQANLTQRTSRRSMEPDEDAESDHSMFCRGASLGDPTADLVFTILVSWKQPPWTIIKQASSNKIQEVTVDSLSKTIINHHSAAATAPLSWFQHSSTVRWQLVNY